MKTRSWSRDDVRNILVALLAAKAGPLLSGPPPAGAEAYAAGCRAAMQALLLALGFPPETLESPVQTGPVTPRGVITQLWLLEDLENLIVTLYRSTISVPRAFHSLGEMYRQGFAEVCQELLAALGSSVQLEPPARRRTRRVWKETPPDSAEE